MNPDQLIASSRQAVRQIDWGAWVPHFADPVHLPRMFPGEAPLTESIVVQYASLHAWVDGRYLTLGELSVRRDELGRIWMDARTTGDRSRAADALADAVLWNALLRMPRRKATKVREALRGRREAAVAASLVARLPQPAWEQPVAASPVRQPLERAPEPSSAAAEVVEPREQDSRPEAPVTARTARDPDVSEVIRKMPGQTQQTIDTMLAGWKAPSAPGSWLGY
jgi:hypothetical protein